MVSLIRQLRVTIENRPVAQLAQIFSPPNQSYTEAGPAMPKSVRFPKHLDNGRFLTELLRGDGGGVGG